MGKGIKILHKVSIIIPTYNEEKNIKRLLQEIHLSARMHKFTFDYEAIVVDDSKDKTAMIARHYGANVIKGQHKGLGQAIVDGIGASESDVVQVMDADLSHSPHDIPRLLEPIIDGSVDFTLGSRYVSGGSTVGWTLKRKIISKVASMCALPVTRVKDATSGFFAFRKDLLDGHNIEASSWKIMLEILVKTAPAKVVEVPIQFKDRVEGESKFDSKQTLAYLKHIIKLIVYKYRVFNFMVVGGIGYVINMATYYPLTLIFKTEVVFWGQHFYLPPFVISSLIAIFSNYKLNKRWTFKGWYEKSFSGVRYFSMALVTLLIDMLFLYILVDYVHMAPVPAAALAILIVFIMRYSIAKRWIWLAKR